MNRNDSKVSGNERFSSRPFQRMSKLFSTDNFPESYSTLKLVRFVKLSLHIYIKTCSQYYHTSGVFHLRIPPFIRIPPLKCTGNLLGGGYSYMLFPAEGRKFHRVPPTFFKKLIRIPPLYVPKIF